MNNVALYLLPLFIGFLLDLAIGDPHWFPHPIRLIGWLIARCETVCRTVFPKTKKGEYAGGICLTVFVLCVCFAVPSFILWLAYQIHFVLAIVIETIMCYQILAVKALETESMKVFRELDRGDLEAAKQKVSMIVGRDTENLTEEGIIKAAVETVAENTSDGTVAPMLFMAIGGAPLGFLYKAVNTMDSMIGYRNDRYLYFGRFAARLDDAFNFIPARLAAVLMIGAAFLLRLDAKNAVRIFSRDRFNHASPNSAQTESVCAGALDVQLAGDACYFGKLYPKKTIGDDIRPIIKQDIILANRLLYGTAWLTLLLCLLGMGLVRWLI
ncbi:adenosylcobinamide-phosphate synthase CbiB [Clostridium aminobutyricum]|uniref:Cobalamin biosynthesis protein CobD n=1 Tax=Clostridium aminobutyricum TaxID=33953 RepID=A0A939D7Y7_CLOAM|nr:adenosylcobinamide-phosphate synthase CbiB [Clostridium aminobutyricum]MBN7772398.1 cobalamin biosynthesis protein CobD [Clostridium aminobutyricum]